MDSKPIHPFLIAPLPLLYMLYVNLDQVHSLAATRIVSLTVLGVAVIYGLAWLLLRKPIRAGMVASFCVLLWYNWNLLAFLVLVVLLVVLAAVVWKRKGRIESIINFFLNAVSISLTVFLVFMIAVIGLRRDLHIFSRHVAPNKNLPDVYFIVLDSYGASSVLQERFGYNNQPFITQLQQMGFRVGECLSTATLTDESLTAILNSDPKLTYSYDRLVHSALRTTLEKRGYSTWAFSTGWIWTEFMDADRYYMPAYGPLTEFEAFALTLTPLRSLIDLDAARGNMTRLRALTLLAHLPDAAADPGAQFIFTHIVQPHPPFVFGPNGETLNPSALENSAWNFGDKLDQEFLPDFYARGYIGQLQYLETRLLPILEQIVNTSPESIIILTGDHGPWYGKNDYQTHAVLCSTRGLESMNALDAVNEIMIK
jgi:hypothetical protein